MPKVDFYELAPDSSSYVHVYGESGKVYVTNYDGELELVHASFMGFPIDRRIRIGLVPESQLRIDPAILCKSSKIRIVCCKDRRNIEPTVGFICWVDS